MRLVPGTLLLAIVAAPTIAQAQSTSTPLVGEIEAITVDTGCTDRWCGGTMTVSGQPIVIPRNLLIDLPANRLTLVELFTEAPPACLAAGETGLASTDTCLAQGSGRAATATILSNRNSCGTVIAGDVFIEKGPGFTSGKVTFVNHTDGYFRLNGTIGTDNGMMVRLNDPTGRHTIQQGLGCAGGPNCSPDPRFTNDQDNYTLAFSTGYPACIPSTVIGGARTVGSNAAGAGDAFCPATNRGVDPVPDSTRFAPLRVGDDVLVEGATEVVSGVRFFSAHTMTVQDALVTRDDPTQPDYLVFAEVEIDVPGFQNERARALVIGFSTLPTSQVDVFTLRVDPTDNTDHEDPFGSTVGNPGTVNQGIGAGAPGIFKIRYDVDFAAGVDARRSPCTNLINAGFGAACPNGGTLAEEFSILSPISRELIGRTRRTTPLAAGVVARDLRGVVAPSGEYLTPIGMGHPEFVEIDLDRIQTPFLFAGIPWNLDRRLSPGGCAGQCESTPQPLIPFPFSGLDPRTQAAVPAAARDRILTYFTFPGGVKTTNLLAWPPADPCTLTPNPPPQALNDAATTPAGAAVTVAVLANDTDPNGAVVASSVAIVSPPASGTAVVNLDGSITFTPATGFSGTATFTYTVTDNQGAVSNVAQVSVTVASPPPPPLPVAQLAPTVLTFPAGDVGTTGDLRNVTLTNTGTAGLSVSAVVMAGTNPADFRISSDGCVGRVIAPAGTCTVGLRFAPTAAGARSARLSVTDNAAGSPHRVALSGTGRAPAVALSPTSMSFGSLAVGATSFARAVTLTNTGTAALQIAGISLAGTHPADFAISASTCGATLAPTARCSFQVRFVPKGGGARSGRVLVTSNATGSPHAVALAGTGLAPAIALSPSSLTFTSPVGITSAVSTVRVTNTGNASLRVSGVSLGGVNPLEFVVSSNSCPASLAPGGSCAIGVRFRPRSAGAKSAQLTVPSNAPSSPNSVALSGNLTSQVGLR